MINEHKTSGAHISFWTNTVPAKQYESLTGNIETDVVIVGGGIAGLSIAYALASGGRAVAVIEDGLPGSGETGRTTAHLVTALDDRYYHIAEVHGKEKAKLAAESHAAAIDWVEDTIRRENIDCQFERLDGYLFLDPTDKPESIEKEYEAASEAGVLVSKVDHIPGLPGEKAPALRFSRQAQFHIMKYLNGLADAVIKYGGRIFTGTHASKIGHEGIETEQGFIVKTRHIVIATNSPVNNRFVIHTKQSQHRTYVLGARIKKGSVPKALWWDTGNQEAKSNAKPYHYVRIQDLDAEYDLLISGGEDHVTGVTGKDNTPEENRYIKLEKWTRERFPVEDIPYYWSGQVMETMDGMAFIGHNPLDRDNIYIVTGDSGNGMTHCTIAAMMIPDLIDGKKHRWQDLYDPNRFKIFSAGGTFIKDTVNFVAEMFKGYSHHPEMKAFREVKKDEGRVVEVNGERYGAYRDKDETLHIVSAICPHLKCVVKWNNDEDSWDCPCHGSRFTVDGKVINGPANSDLPYFHFPQEKF